MSALHSPTWIAVFLAIALIGSFAHAGQTITVNLPRGSVAASASATATELKTDLPGKINGTTVIFDNVLPDTPYDVRITLTDGTILQGVNLGWYIDEPPKPDAGPLNEDDREQITRFIKDVKQFTNKNEFLFLQGDHDRATALAQLIRDTAFHADKGGEIIWRIELWYFKVQAGGWEKVQQQNKVLRRERFTSAEAFKAATEKIKWTPALGGIRVGKDQATEVQLPVGEIPTKN